MDTRNYIAAHQLGGNKKLRIHATKPFLVKFVLTFNVLFMTGDQAEGTFAYNEGNGQQII